MKIFCLTLSFLLFLFLSPDISLSENARRSFSAKEHSQKIWQIAGIIAVEINRRGIKTIEVREFTDMMGRHSNDGRDISKEFERQMSIIAGDKFKVVSGNADAIVTGTLTPFKGKKKWQLNIKIISRGTGKAIASYSGILKKR